MTAGGEGPSVAVGLLATRGPGELDDLLGAVLPQLRGDDVCMVALAAGVDDPAACLERLEAARSSHPGPISPVLLPTTTPGRPVHGGRAAAVNRLLEVVGQEVVAVVDDRTAPASGWLAGVRGCISDPGIDLVACRLRDRPVRDGGRPGGRLRWTGHVQADYATHRTGATTLAHPAAFAVRRETAVDVGGFDERFDDPDDPLPLGDVEFFVRLAKAGGRGRYCPRAAVAWLTADDPYEAQWGRSAPGATEPLESAGAVTRAMAAVFSRHEAWALLIMGASHLAGSLPEVAAGRLPRGAPVRILSAFTEGVRMGVEERHEARRARRVRG